MYLVGEQPKSQRLQRTCSGIHQPLSVQWNQQKT